MKTYNRAVIEEYRASGGKLGGPMAGRTVLLLTTTGRNSGQPRTVVLGYGRDGDRFVVIASNNGAPQEPLWYRNLKANPRAVLEVGPDKFDVTARTADRHERQELTLLVPYLESQQKLTSREIPIVVFSRRGGLPFDAPR